MSSRWGYRRWGAGAVVGAALGAAAWFGGWSVLTGASVLPATAAAAPAGVNPTTPIVPVSGFTGAGYTDIAVASDGLLHAVWQDVPTGVTRKQVLHSASRDGRQWSTPVNLSDASDERSVTTVRAAIDGAGRVYAFWKVHGTGTMGSADVAGSNTRGAEHGSLRYRVLERGQWSAIVEVSRDNKVFAWFPAVDAAGRMHLVWSENSDPAHTGVTVWRWEVNSVLHAQLDGTVARSTRVLIHEPNTGFWGLSGYMDDRGRPRFVGVRQNGGDTSDQQYFHFDGSSQSVLAPVSRFTGSEERGGVQLLRGAGGAEHLIYYAAGAGAIAALPLGRNPDVQPIALYRLPPGEGGQITGFQAIQGAGGALAVAVQAKPAAGGMGADLFVAQHRGGRWGEPVNVTDNAGRVRAAGVVGSNGSALGSVSTYSALYAGAALDPSGGLSVLMSNNEASVPVNTRVSALGTYSFRGGWSFPKAYFARLGGSALRSAAPPASAAVRAGRIALGAPGATTPAAPGAPAAPAPAATPSGPAAGGLPTGTYACSYPAQYVGDLPTGTSVTILDGGQYRAQDGRVGSYTYDRASNTVRWTSGPFADRSVNARYSRRSDGTSVIQVAPAAGGDPRDTHTCVR